MVAPFSRGVAARAASGSASEFAVPPVAVGERLCREDTLRQRGDYLRCYRTGRRRSGKFLLLYVLQNQVSRPRLGITASRKVGSSVMRHRLKRRVRESFRRWPERKSLAALDLVVHLQPACAKATFRALNEELSKLLRDAARRSPPP
ncbi:MAG: ribonuclease P protein component [Acidobacteriota bacterium]